MNVSISACLEELLQMLSEIRHCK